jgi:hypothetical protein
MPACVNKNNLEQRQNISPNELKRSFCAIRKYSAWDRCVISKPANAAVSKQHTASSCRGFPPLFLAFCARASFAFSASSGFCVSRVPSLQRRQKNKKGNHLGETSRRTGKQADEAPARITSALLLEPPIRSPKLVHFQS